MKKVLSFTLASLALAALASPAYAQFGGSIRGDVGMLGSQVPYLTVVTGVAPTLVESFTRLSDRKEGEWDFTGRLFIYTSCAPCSTYIAGSWQGSNHTVDTCDELTVVSDLNAVIPLFGLELNIGASITGALGLPFTGVLSSPVLSRVEVKNKFSKAKLGMGFDLIKTNCFAFTMEVGGNYLNAELHTDRDTFITQTIAEGPGTLVLPGVLPDLISAPLVALVVNNITSPILPYDYVLHENTCQKTEGVGMYASFKAEYKFPASCLGNCFSVYGKAEVADIIGRQSYSDRLRYENEFALVGTTVPVLTFLVDPLEYEFAHYLCNRYNNIVEVDLEAALVYAPCFKCWDNLNLNFALGVRTDSFVNLFSTPTGFGFANESFLSLTRPTVFLEIGIKV